MLKAHLVVGVDGLIQPHHLLGALVIIPCAQRGLPNLAKAIPSRGAQGALARIYLNQMSAPETCSIRSRLRGLALSIHPQRFFCSQEHACPRRLGSMALDDAQTLAQAAAIIDLLV